MAPIEIIRLYGLRFKIELSFKQALRVLGVYAYHFWMRAMDKIARGSGTQYLHHKDDDYRQAVRRKIGAYSWCNPPRIDFATTNEPAPSRWRD
jgi:hypothetical protein